LEEVGHEGRGHLAWGAAGAGRTAGEILC
jgi:hypothetical protein